MRNKKRNYFAIWGKNLSTGKREKIDQATSESDLSYMMNEYSIAFGKTWVIYCPQLQGE